MVTVLLSLFLIFQVLNAIGNPYLLATFLLGPYAIIAAIQFSTGARPSRLPEHSVIWIVVLYLAIWTIYMVNKLGGVTLTTYQINTVPFGIMVAAGLSVLCAVYLRLKGQQ